MKWWKVEVGPTSSFSLKIKFDQVPFDQMARTVSQDKGDRDLTFTKWWKGNWLWHLAKTLINTDQVPFDWMARAISQAEDARVLCFTKWRKGKLLHEVVRIESKERSSSFWSNGRCHFAALRWPKFNLHEIVKWHGSHLVSVVVE